MSGTLPTTPGAGGVAISQITPTFESVAHSLKRQVRTLGAHRWRLVYTYDPMLRATAAPLFAFLMSQRGRFETFTTVIHGYRTPQGTATGTPLVNDPGASLAAGDTSVPTDGWTNGITALKAGDFIKFGGHAKVYMVTADATANGSGEATLTITPPLQAVPADNEALTVSEVPMTVALASDVTEWLSRGGGPLVDGLTIEMVEVP